MTRALVTGGGTGIGRGIAATLRGLGWDVVITGRRVDVLEDTASQLGCKAVAADVRGDPAELLGAAGPIDHLVHSAGHTLHRPVGQWEADDFLELFDVHVVAPALLTQAWAAGRTGGSVVFVSSTLGRRGAPGTGPYAAAKAGMLALCRDLAIELAPQGIRSNAVLPGVVETDMAAVPRGELHGAAYLDSVRPLHLLGRLGTPQDVAAAVGWLCTAEWVTGAEIPVDGGLLARG